MADFASKRQSQARKAYGNSAQSIALHGKQMQIFNVQIRKNGAINNRTAVLASYFGLCEAALLAGTYCGLHSKYYALSSSSFLFSCSSVHRVLHILYSYLSLSRAASYAVLNGSCIALVAVTCLMFERNVYDIQLDRELWEIDNDLTGQMQQMIQIYKSQGLSDEQALVVTRIFAKRKESFAELMMVEQLGYSRLDPPKLWEVLVHVGLPTICFNAISFILPLVPLFYCCYYNRKTLNDMNNENIIVSKQNNNINNNNNNNNNNSNTIVITNNSSNSNNTKQLLTSALQSNTQDIPLPLTYCTHAMVAGLLSVGAAVVSAVQVKVFLGDYGRRKHFVRSTIGAVTALSIIYSLSYITARL